MTRLFIETKKIVSTKNDNLDVVIQRSGKAATILNLAFLEPQTVQRVFNEFFSLLANPSLDSVFINPDTGRLKEHFVFMDNAAATAAGQWSSRSSVKSNGCNVVSATCKDLGLKIGRSKTIR